MSEIKFGTDGWRAIIAEDFTFENVRRVSQAAAEHWCRNLVPNASKLVVIGYDRRFLSAEFGRAAAETFHKNGFEVILTSVATPTPAVSYAVKTHHAIGGVMITASHNPASFNGYKLKAHFGGSAQEATCHAVEALIDRTRSFSGNGHYSTREGFREEDLRPAHYAAIRKQVDMGVINRTKLRIAHDAMHGVGAGCFPELLGKSRCNVTTLNGEHDPNFGGVNPEPILANYGKTVTWLRKHPQDLCLVTDGDADRIGAMDGRGGYLTSHQIICLLIHHLVENRQSRGRVIKAINTTSMVDKMCLAYGLGMTETSVGFKYITPELLKGNALLGAEDSGGIAFAKFLPERDGLLAGLMLMELLATERVSVNKILAGLEKEFGPHRYGRIDSPFPLERRPELLSYCRENPPDKLLRSPVVNVLTSDGVKFVAQDSSWLLLRASGTEPIIRIYAETATEQGVGQLLNAGMQMAKQALKPAGRRRVREDVQGRVPDEPMLAPQM